MLNFIDYPMLVLTFSFAVLWIAAFIGTWIRKKRPNLIADQEDHQDLVFVLGGTLTLLGLIIGFAFSMAVSRYDKRKDCEAEEANAIGTEYLRAGLLPSTDAAVVRDLLRKYVYVRIREYQTRRKSQPRELDSETAKLQDEMWSAAIKPAPAQPSAVTALAIAGMNDVLNSQGYTQAAFRNRIPSAAWGLLVSIAIFCNFLVGYSAHRRGAVVLLILPIALGICLFLIADIDSPNGGMIRIVPRNLESTAASMNLN